ncbi:6,7-dimethyl-8-ribityllumazine synthase, partial [Gammaproteobacteria bacterium SCGC AG-212-F23]
MQIINRKEINNGFNIAIVTSHYNQEITQALFTGAVDRLQQLGFKDEQITAVSVPGAVEIPLAAQRLALTKKFEAIICLGAVIFGETKHFDYVCEQVSQGCQQVALTHNLPVIFGVLTTMNLDQAKARVGGHKGHVGRECADAAVWQVSVLRQ